MTTTPQTLFVCPTSHLDWDWINSFEQYYSLGYPGSSCDVLPVRYTFDQMTALLDAPSSTFCFSLAELGYLHRWLVDNPDAAPALRKAGARLCLMGGGVTSPDNLVCHGETFIRNFLVGNQWLKRLGLYPLRQPLAWLPDDFGHDPQLPVVLRAMGMTAVGFSRVPGSVQGTPCAQPLAVADRPSVAAQLMKTSGLVFLWNASDGSQLIAHFMPDTYSVSTSDLASFVTTYGGDAWNGPNLFVPVPSCDFATPTTAIQEAIDAYNKNPVGDVTARMGTFQDFIFAVQQNPGGLGAPFTLRASNYWTGYFASRPELKILHARAARELMAAEAAGVLLRVYSQVAAAVGNAIDRAVETGWENLLPTTHHDYVTGTSPDWINASEQEPLARQAAELAEHCRRQATRLFADSVQAQPRAGETPVVVINTLGFARGGVVELPPSAIAATTASVRGPDGPCAIQPLPDGGLLFQAPPLPSLGWNTFYLLDGDPPSCPTAPAAGDSVVLENALLSVTLTATSSWFITSFYDKSAQRELVRSSRVANEIRLYQDSGNLYQFGNEPLACPPGFGTFRDQRASYQVGEVGFVEYGPLRQRFVALLQDTKSGHYFELEYTLVAGEPFLRMRTTGSAPPSTSVVAAFPLVSENGLVPDGLTHGTANHWDGVEPVRYWDGPTFQATHDFVLPTESTAAQPCVAAVYHADVPAWCRDQGTITDKSDVGTVLGALLRYTDGTQRGAAGTDPRVHTREYALRVPSGLGAPSTGIPLQESLAMATPLYAELQEQAIALPNRTSATGSLASVSPPSVMVRAVRGQAGSGTTASPKNPPYATGAPTSFVLRLYSPDAAATASTVTLPFADTRQPIAAQLVTALEEPIDGGGLTPDGQTIPVPTPYAITTVRVQTNRVYGPPNNGR